MVPIISWLLPEPDSPTMATVSPALTSRFTPLTASTMPSSVLKLTFMFLSVRMLRSISAVLRVKRVTQTIADEVQGEERGGKEDGRKDNQPVGRWHVLGPLRNHHAPAGHGLLNAKAQIGQEAFENDDVGHQQG